MKNNIIISSRIRLARNLKGLPFPSRLSDDDVAESITKAIYEVFGEDFSFRRLKNMTSNQCLMGLENRTLSKELLDNKDISSFAISEDECISIMINEEDHIREQCIKKGFCLDECYEAISKIDDRLVENLDMAFSEKLGFLTASPTNIGTGMRASVMMFLPALTISGTIKNIITNMEAKGLTVRGLYGEGSSAEGYFYQISNQVTLGLGENEIIEMVKTNVENILELENSAQKTIINLSESVIMDMCLRAYGTLTNCYILGAMECVGLLSKVRFGVTSGLIKLKNPSLLDKLYDEIQPAHLMNYFELEMSPKERDVFRAKYVRESLRNKLVENN